MRKPPTLFYLWLLVLTIASAGVWFRLISERDLKAQVLLTGFMEKGLAIQKDVAGIMEQEQTAIFKELAENAEKSFEVFGKYSTAGQIPEDDRNALDAALKSLLHSEVNLILFGESGEILYAYLGDDDFMFTAVLRNAVLEKPTGFARLPLSGGSVAYSTFNSERLRACAFTPSSKITALIGDELRDQVRSMAVVYLEQYVSGQNDGHAFFYLDESSDKQSAPADFDTRALANADADILHTYRQNLLKETVFARGAIVPFLNISGVNYYSRITPFGVMLAVFGIAAILALFSWIGVCLFVRPKLN